LTSGAVKTLSRQPDASPHLGAPLRAVLERPPFIVVQGSSRSWAGGRDYCLHAIKGEPVILRTLKKISERFPDSRIVIAAPEFDRGGLFDAIVASFGHPNLTVFYGHNESPLRRIVSACSSLSNNDLILKVDALHFVFDVELSLSMLAQASALSLDCVKPRDDFPAQLSSEVYRYGALKDAAARITEQERNFEIHPKFYFFKDPKYKSQYSDFRPAYGADFLSDCRKSYAGVYAERYDVTNLAVPLGDMISFHYQHATSFLKNNMTILDIACGNGFGSKLVAPFVSKVVGADLSPSVIEMAQVTNPGVNVSYVVDDITRLKFAHATFDAVLTFETFEHVDTALMMAEIKRVLKADGLLIMSTPQNCIGDIPICHEHVKEYSLDELIQAVSSYFDIVHIDGIKAGTICIDNDPIGANTFLVARKKLH
jgi:2-polyprenyl-3-methyl-5-hydroxy-6-metoxy-1,4-benzoquinol methylase